MSTLSAKSSGVPHSDLAYRALLRNLKMLKGMRFGKTEFEALITGVGADEAASHMKAMEPSINFIVASEGRQLSASKQAAVYYGCN